MGIKIKKITLDNPSRQIEFTGGWKIDSIHEEDICFTSGAFIKKTKRNKWILVDKLAYPCTFYKGFKSKEHAIAIGKLMFGEIMDTSAFKARFKV